MSVGAQLQRVGSGTRRRGRQLQVILNPVTLALIRCAQWMSATGRKSCSHTLAHTRRLAKLAGPLFIEGATNIGTQLVATTCVSRLGGGPLALSALVLAQTQLNFGYSIICGIAAAMETCCGQVWQGIAAWAACVHTCRCLCAVSSNSTNLISLLQP